MSVMPTLTDTGQRLYDALAPLAQQDPQNGYALANFCAALAKMVDPVANIVRDPDAGSSTTPGWAKVFDVNNVDPSWLPWLSQFTGTDVSAVTDVPTQRSLIKNPAGYNRGTVAGMRAAAQVTLTGTKTVLIYERPSGSAFTINVFTYASETPNWQATQAALRSVKPSWVVMTYSLALGGTYSLLASSHATYSAMEARHSTYSDIPNNPGA